MTQWKSAFRDQRRAMSLPEKLDELVTLQQLYCAIAHAVGRPLKPHETPWMADAVAPPAPPRGRP